MKKSKPRNTLAKQIINLAKADDQPSNERAMFIAKHGRPFLNEEQELLDFYIYFEHLKDRQKLKEFVRAKKVSVSETPEEAAIWDKSIEAAVERFGSDISKIFLKAVKEYDADKILKIAKAVCFFKGKLDPDYFHKDGDQKRHSLLLLKHQLQQFNKKWTIRQVAEFFGGKKVGTPADGFSALRKQCHDLNFPLA